MSRSVTLVVLNLPEDIGAVSRSAHPRVSFRISSATIIDQLSEDSIAKYQAPRAFGFDNADGRCECNADETPLHYTYASEFGQIISDESESVLSWFDKAALAYINVLPADYIIVLYWS